MASTFCLCQESTKFIYLFRCQSSSRDEFVSSKSDLQIGSPIVVIEAPPALKTATPRPSLRINSGLVKPGDVGRIVARKPKDVWAVRLGIGTYLLDGKNFRPLELNEESSSS